MAKYRLGIFVCALALVFVSSFKTIKADDYSQNSSGPSIIVDKKVRPISDSNFYDNIDPRMKVFNENEQIEFLITVTNNSNQVLNDVEVKDYLPKYLSLLFYPGSYDPSRVITDEIGQLGIGETRTLTIRGYISDVPTTTLTTLNIVQINKACAGNNLVSDCDQAQYFIAAKNVPPTGADDIGIKSAAILMIAISAVGLRKLARGY